MTKKGKPQVPRMTPEEEARFKAELEAEFPLMTWKPGEAPRNATPFEVGLYQFKKDLERLPGMKADFIIMDDPHALAAPPLDWRMVQYAGGTVEGPACHNLPKADYSEIEKRMLAYYAEKTEKAVMQALLYGSSIHRIESDGTWTPVPPDEAFEPKGGESLFDMFQRKLFEREASGGFVTFSKVNDPTNWNVEASAEPVYQSQFPDSVFNPTADVRGFAARLIDTSD